jgi:hypothetical protein
MTDPLSWRDLNKIANHVRYRREQIAAAAVHCQEILDALKPVDRDIVEALVRYDADEAERLYEQPDAN